MRNNPTLIRFSDKEILYLEKMASAEQIPVNLYILKTLFPQKDLYINTEKIINNIKNMKSGEIFYTSTLIKELNLKIDRSDLSFIGKCIKNCVKILNLEEVKKVAGVQLYKKL